MKHEYTKELNHFSYKPMMAILVVYEVLLRSQFNDDEYIHPHPLIISYWIRKIVRIQEFLE